MFEVVHLSHKWSNSTVVESVVMYHGKTIATVHVDVTMGIVSLLDGEVDVSGNPVLQEHLGKTDEQLTVEAVQRNAMEWACRRRASKHCSHRPDWNREALKMGAYRVLERAPTLEEYRCLCVAVGWEAIMNFDAATAALNNSLYSVVAVDVEQVVGMGRIVGDGAIYYYIQDIVVLPTHQRRGIGTTILDALMDYLRHHAPEKAFAGLFAAEGTVPFYEQHGFKDYAPSMTGMFLVTPIN